MDASPNVRRRLATALVVLAVVALSAWPALDRFAITHTDQALGRALAAFAIARGINGAISVAQSTQVAVQPAGIGVSLSPGEILDPVNDLVEQFSSLMLAASISFGLQRVLVVASGWLPLQLLLGVVALAWAILWIRGSRWGLGPLRTLLVMLLLLRLAVPVVALASEAAYQTLLAGEYDRSSTALAQARDAIVTGSEALRAPQPSEDGLLERARSWLDATRESLDPSAQLEKLEASATEVTRQVVNLVALFVVQTLLLPLGFLALFLRLGRWLLRAGAAGGAP